MEEMIGRREGRRGKRDLEGDEGGNRNFDMKCKTLTYLYENLWNKGKNFFILCKLEGY